MCLPQKLRSLLPFAGPTSTTCEVAPWVTGVVDDTGSLCTLEFVWTTALESLRTRPRRRGSSNVDPTAGVRVSNVTRGHSTTGRAGPATRPRRDTEGPSSRVYSCSRRSVGVGGDGRLGSQKGRSYPPSPRNSRWFPKDSPTRVPRVPSRRRVCPGLC